MRRPFEKLPNHAEHPLWTLLTLIAVLAFVFGALSLGRPMETVAGMLGAVFTTAGWFDNRRR